MDSTDDAVAVANGSTPVPGADGVRREWMATFLSTAPRGVLRVVVADGTVSRVDPGPYSSAPTLTVTPRLDSGTALELATSHWAQLKPASLDGKGYEYLLDSDSSGRAVLSVRGESASMPVEVSLDAVTGAVLGSYVYDASPDVGGVLVSHDGGASWAFATGPGGQVMNFVALGTGGTDALALHPTAGGVQLLQTTSAGDHWSLATTLPPAAGLWAYALAAFIADPDSSPLDVTLAVGTPSGLWLSSADAFSWTHDASLPSGPPEWIEPLGAANDRLVVSISAGTNKGVYVSQAGMSSWTRLLSGTFRLSRLTDGSVAAVAEVVPNPGAPSYTITEDSGKVSTGPLKLPARTLRVSGSVDVGGGGLFAESPGALELRTSNDASTWGAMAPGPASLNINFTGLAVSPGSAAGAPSAVLVGTLGRGIFRSSDDGASWM